MRLTWRGRITPHRILGACRYTARSPKCGDLRAVVAHEYIYVYMPRSFLYLSNASACATSRKTALSKKFSETHRALATAGKEGEVEACMIQQDEIRRCYCRRAKKSVVTHGKFCTFPQRNQPLCSLLACWLLFSGILVGTFLVRLLPQKALSNKEM